MQPPPPRVLPAARRVPGIGTQLRQWRLPPIETYPTVIAFVQTYPGKLLLFATCAALMKVVAGDIWPNGVWLELTISAAVVSLAGRYRRHVALLCTAVLLARVPFNFGAVYATMAQEGLVEAIHPGYLRAATFIACALLAMPTICLARRFHDHRFGRRPVLLQHLLALGLLGLATSHLLMGTAQVLLWSVTATLCVFFWFLAYALIEQRSRNPAPLLQQIASYFPFLGLTTVPWGKGTDNWRRADALTAQDLAVVQIKALKLLAWALILKCVLWGFRKIVYVKLGVTPLRIVLERFLEGNGTPTPFGPLSVIASFPEQLLAFAIWGHGLVAIARLGGFPVLRNSCRPLSSRTIAEFWNRYFFYFKEMLVNVYFYPTYVRCFKSHPRLRIAFATFMAAAVGNFFFHVILDARALAEFGLVDGLVRFQSYAFYCLMLATGIVLSQLRVRRTMPDDGWVRGQLVPSLGVATFFCFLSLFDGPQSAVTVAQRFAFLFHVLGVDQWIKATG